MKFLKKHRRGGQADELPDVEVLLSIALMERDLRRAAATESGESGAQSAEVPQPGGIANDRLEPTDEQRARAQSLLYDFAMRHFSSQVEAIRRDAVIEHLEGRIRDRMRFRRLFFIAVLGTLAAFGLMHAGTAVASRYGITFDQVVDLILHLVATIRTRVGV